MTKDPTYPKFSVTVLVVFSFQKLCPGVCGWGLHMSQLFPGHENTKFPTMCTNIWLSHDGTIHL